MSGWNVGVGSESVESTLENTSKVYLRPSGIGLQRK